MMRWWCICALVLCGSAALAEDRSTFDIYVSGLKAGTLALAGNEANGRYRVRGTGQSAGITRGLVRFSVEAAASGRVRGNTYQSSQYTETLRNRDGTTKRTFSYRGGQLQIERSAPEANRRSHHIGPEGQADTLDPLTSIWAFMRDRPNDLACNLKLRSYNGRQRVSIQLSNAQRQDDQLVCQGIYRREAGYSAKELAKQRVWRFTLTYRIADAILRVEELRLRSTFGPMVFRRR